MVILYRKLRRNFNVAPMHGDLEGEVFESSLENDYTIRGQLLVLQRASHHQKIMISIAMPF